VEAEMLSQSDIQRAKLELGFNQLTIGAEPYLGITRFFEQIVQSFINSGVLTFSSTVVAASPTLPTAVALTLTSPSSGTLPPGTIAPLDHVIVDVDAAQEFATVMSVTSNAIVVQLSKAHGAGGAYPIEQEGGEALVRIHLNYLRKIADRIQRFGARAGVKKADEVEFFGGAHGRAAEANGFQTLEQMQTHFRRELCMLLFGVGSIAQFQGSGGQIGLY
jgi:hypothetical protein